jgi:arginine deiminase
LRCPNPSTIFLAVDEVISLLPYSVLKKFQDLLEAKETEELVKLLLTWAGKIDKVRADLELLNVDDFHAEDDEKRRILLLMPGEKQLGVVEGHWAEWVWSPRTLLGDKAPDLEGWLADLMGLGEALKDEGVEVIFTINSEEEDMFLERAGKTYNYLVVDMPSGKAKIGYVRDQSVAWFRHPIICNMALDIRSGEEPVLNEVYWRLGVPPIFRPRWANIGGMLERAVLEGGNFTLVRGDEGVVLFTGIGVRGTNMAAIKALSKILPPEISIYAVPLSGYIKSWRETGTVHLDVAMLYGGKVNGWRMMLVDPGRIGFYSVFRYQPSANHFVPEELGQIVKTLGVTIDEPPRGRVSRITMTNALNLGNGKLVVDPYNEDVNRYLEQEWGFDLVQVPIPQLDAGGGGARCSTRELIT